MLTAAAVAAALTLAGGTSSARADTVFTADFECPAYNTAGGFNGQQGWASTAGVLFSGITPPTGGSNSLRLIGTTGVPLISADQPLNISTANGQVVTVEFDYRRTGQTDIQAGVSLIGDTGFIGQLAGNSGWLGADSAWHRVVMTVNFAAGTVSGTTDGVSIGTFPVTGSPTRVTGLQLYTFQSTGALTVYFDNVVVSASTPSNDACADALPIATGMTDYSNTNSTTDGPGACGSFGRDIWYVYTAPADGVVTAFTCGSGYDTVLAAYSGACGSLTGLDCNDDTPDCSAACISGRGSRVSFPATAGTSYRIRVGGFSGSFGTGTVTLELNTSGACCNTDTGMCTIIDAGACTDLGLDFQGFATTCGASPCIACPADFNNSGATSVQDIFDFLAAYFAGCP